MKLRTRKNKTLTFVIIALAVLAVIGIVIGIILLIPEKKESRIEISLSTLPDKTIYYIGQKFDPKGTSVQVLTDGEEGTYFVDYTELAFSGFDSSVSNKELPITISYKGVTTSFTVEIREYPSDDTSVMTGIRMSDDFKKTYTLERWTTNGPRFRGANIICTYSDGSEKAVPMKSEYASGVDLQLTEPGQTEFTVTYEGFEITVQVIITE